MTTASVVDRKSMSPNERPAVTRGTVLKVFCVIALVSFVLRIVYAGHLYEDDGLWFTAGEEIVRGKALYREIYFDKPPGLALFYALLSWLFGAHIITIRLFTIAYSVAIAGAIYLFGSWLYDKRTGLFGAVIFSIFSTTYVTGHVQGLSTDLLMSLPYTAAAYLMARSASRTGLGRRPAWLAAAGGWLTGVAFQINPKGLIDLLFLTVVLYAARGWNRSPGELEARSGESKEHRSALKLFGLAAAGSVVGALPFFVYVMATGSSRAYWSYVWDWGARYGRYYGPAQIVLTALTRTADYLTLNNTLLIALAFVVILVLRRRNRGAPHAASRLMTANLRDVVSHQSDITLLIWLGASYLGVMIGGRFFGHYFIQILPALCLIGARGLTAILAELRQRSATARQAVLAVLVLGFAFTLIRFHGRGALLAADFLRGKVSKTNADWYYSQRAREERMVAAVVRDLPEGAEAGVGSGLEAMRARGPRTRAPEGPADYLFVWGYRPEIYYWSGLLPASRFLSSQALTGVPADVHYFRDSYRSVLEESVTARARAQLLLDLEATRPKYIVDEIGFFNNDLGILQYPELREFMSAYKPIGATGRFFIYVRNDLRKKYQLRHSTDQR